MAKVKEEKKEEVKENWVLYEQIGNGQVIAVKTVEGVKYYLLK